MDEPYALVSKFYEKTDYVFIKHIGNWKEGVYLTTVEYEASIEFRSAFVLYVFTDIGEMYIFRDIQADLGWLSVPKDWK